MRREEGKVFFGVGGGGRRRRLIQDGGGGGAFRPWRRLWGRGLSGAGGARLGHGRAGIVGVRRRPVRGARIRPKDPGLRSASSRPKGVINGVIKGSRH